MNEQRPFYDRPLIHPAGEGRDIVVQRDISYLDEDDPRALMDIYLPAGEKPAGGFPTLLFLHGGPLADSGQRPWPKEWRVFQDYGRLAAEKGLAGVVINHRYSGYEGLVQAMADAGQAATFLAEEAGKFGLNGDRIALWVFSGAGMLLRPFLSGEYRALRGLVAFYPLLDLTHIPQAADVYSDDELIALSPLSVVDRVESALPLYVVRAGRDRPGLNRALDTFIKQALYHNLNLETRNLPQAGHGFDMLEDSAAGRMAIARGFEFAAANLHED